MSAVGPSAVQGAARPAVAALPLGLARGFGRQLLRLPRWVGLLLALAWMGTIHVLSSGELPVKPRLPFAGFFNNLGHAPVFGLLALFWTIALPRRRAPFPWARLDKRAVLAVLLAVLAYGVADELHQARVPERDGNPLDALTDLVGAACVLACARAAGRPETGPGRFLRLLLLCLLACAAAAALATGVRG